MCIHVDLSYFFTVKTQRYCGNVRNSHGYTPSLCYWTPKGSCCLGQTMTYHIIIIDSRGDLIIILMMYTILYNSIYCCVFVCVTTYTYILNLRVCPLCDDRRNSSPRITDNVRRPFNLVIELVKKFSPHNKLKNNIRVWRVYDFRVGKSTTTSRDQNTPRK